MLILLFFAFISGLVTILAPCIWPLLPIVLSASATGGKTKPLGITVGIAISFAVFTLFISVLIKLFHLDPDAIRLFAVAVIIFLGITLLIPSLSAKLEAWVSRLSSRFANFQNLGNGFWGGLVTGLSLGIVWSPCAGPILATIATLAATTAVSGQLVLITVVYVIGVGIPLFLFAVAGNLLFTKSRFLNQYLGRIQQVFGVIMILTALAIYTNYDKVLQVKLLDAFPSYTNLLTKFETTDTVTKQLDVLKGTKEQMNNPKLYRASDFVGISHWLNLPAGRQALTIADLKGKVVLVDFWTYTCINCIRTLPHVVNWYDKYHDKGLVIIGVHTPEFEFEKKTENVAAALKQYGIKYPVAQDNDYATWNAYANHYWPAKYLIDKEGYVRYTHFGEGEYDQTEKVIQDLLGISMGTSSLTDQTPTIRTTPETYVGSSRSSFQSQSPNPTLNFFYLGGDWQVMDEYATANKGAYLEEHFFADKVFLVMRPPLPVGGLGRATVKVFLDGKLVNTLTIDTDKLYTLIDLQGNPGDHLLRLEFPTHGIQLYAFTFG